MGDKNASSGLGMVRVESRFSKTLGNFNIILKPLKASAWFESKCSMEDAPIGAIVHPPICRHYLC